MTQEVLDFDNDLKAVTLTFKVDGKEFVIDLVEAEMNLEAEPINIDAEPIDPNRFIPLFQKWIMGKYEVQLGFSQAMKLIDFIRYSYIDFKKKYNEGLKLAMPSAATHLGSLEEKSSSSQLDFLE